MAFPVIQILILKYDLYCHRTRLSFPLPTASLVFIIGTYALFLYSLLYSTSGLTLMYNELVKHQKMIAKSSSSIGDHTIGIYSINHPGNRTLPPHL